MSFLVRRNMVVWVSEQSEVDAVAGLPEELRALIGKSWLEHITLRSDNGFFAVAELSRLTPVSYWDSWGRLGIGRADPIVLRRRSLSSLWGDPWADYLLAVHPDVFFASSGGLWLRPDVWSAGNQPRLISAEWLHATALAISPDGRQVGVVSGLPEAWGVGHILVTVIDLHSGQQTHFGPFVRGVPDVIEWSPTARELWFVMRDESSNEDAAYSLQVDRGELFKTTLPSGIRGLAWSPDGKTLAITHSTEEGAGITVLDSGHSRHFPVGPCWTPVWVGGEHIAYGASEQDARPGDEISVLRLVDGESRQLLSSSTPADGFAVDVRLSGGRPPELLEKAWWSGRYGEQVAQVETVDDPRALSPAAQTDVDAELWCLYYDDPELYAQHKRTLAFES